MPHDYYIPSPLNLQESWKHWSLERSLSDWVLPSAVNFSHWHPSGLWGFDRIYHFLVEVFTVDDPTSNLLYPSFVTVPVTSAVLRCWFSDGLNLLSTGECELYSVTLPSWPAASCLFSTDCQCSFPRAIIFFLKLYNDIHGTSMSGLN